MPKLTNKKKLNEWLEIWVVVVTTPRQFFSEKFADMISMDVDIAIFNRFTQTPPASQW